MASTSLVFLMLVAVALTMALPRNEKKRSIDKRENLETEANDKASNIRELRHLPANFRETMMTKRGIFDCVGFYEECHIFRHCCKHFKCNRPNIFTSGVCILDL